MGTGILYIVATPIGNLQDITLRALETLKQVDLIACEDTRVTSRLLARYEIAKPMTSFHQHSRLSKFDKIIAELKSGKSIALVTDAGTPGVSDPGNMLVAEAVKNKIKIIPIPGASALGAIISVAGIDMQKFVFLGFPPHKKGRETFFKEVAFLKYPAVYYESPHRLIKNLELLSVIASEAPPAGRTGKQSRVDESKNGVAVSQTPRNDIKIILGREITKMFEEIVRGNISEVLMYFQENPDKIKGEFAIIIF